MQEKFLQYIHKYEYSKNENKIEKEILHEIPNDINER